MKLTSVCYHNNFTHADNDCSRTCITWRFERTCTKNEASVSNNIIILQVMKLHRSVQLRILVLLGSLVDVLMKYILHITGNYIANSTSESNYTSLLLISS